MAEPRVSVIMPAHNAAEYIGEALSSLRAQSLADFEVLIVDDASRDETAEIAHSFAAEDKRFKVLNSPARGVSNARNAALDQCRGRYVAFLDADDRLPPDSLFQRAAWLDAHPKARLVSAMWRVIGARGEDLGLTMGRLPSERGFEQAFELPVHICAIMGRGEFVRRFQFNELRAHGEDVKFIIQMLRAGATICPLHHIAFEYRWHKSSAVSSNLPRHTRQLISIMRNFTKSDDSSEVAERHRAGWSLDNVEPRQLSLLYGLCVQLVLGRASAAAVEEAAAQCDALDTYQDVAAPCEQDLWTWAVRAFLAPVDSRALAERVCQRAGGILDLADRLRTHSRFAAGLRGFLDAAIDQAERGARAAPRAISAVLPLAVGLVSGAA